MRSVALRQLVDRRWMRRLLATAALVVAGSLVGATTTQTAIANGDTRTLHLYHTHTGESIDATFRVDGHYDAAVLRQLNHFLRDWRNNDEIAMDPRLFDTLWEAYRTAGANEPIQIYSAYRSPETNAMLRRRSRAVAEHSQHMLGKAMDTTIPGFPMHLVREVGMRLQRGGVGWYPSANFVHLDVGGVRSWPRMSYDQLAGLFPDGKTVHVASNGQVLPGYEAARAEIAAHGGVDLPPSQESGGFFAWLFGGSGGSSAHEDEEDRRAPVAVARAAPAPQVRSAETTLAYAERTPAERPAAVAPLLDRDRLSGRATDEALPVALPVAQPSAQPTPAVQEASDTQLFLPLPPRRPLDLVAAVEVPLPPARPITLGRLMPDAVRAAEASTKSPAFALAEPLPPPRPRLPASGQHLPGTALAYADMAPTGSIKSPNDVVHLRPIGLRAASRSQTASATDASGSASLGPRMTGLRRAARLSTLKADL